MRFIDPDGMAIAGAEALINWAKTCSSQKEASNGSDIKWWQDKGEEGTDVKNTNLVFLKHNIVSQKEKGPKGQGGWDSNGDDKLQKNEADNYWLHGGGVGISVDNSKIDWTGLKIPASAKVGKIFSINTTQAFLKLPYETAATYGGTSFILRGAHTVEVVDQLYHYQYRPNNSAENIMRNFMNWYGKPDGQGTDFMIHYNNPLTIIK